jgi:hypothetical protein
MKKILFVIIAALFMAMVFQSCATSKNGCPRKDISTRPFNK